MKIYIYIFIKKRKKTDVSLNGAAANGPRRYTTRRTRNIRLISNTRSLVSSLFLCFFFLVFFSFDSGKEDAFDFAGANERTSISMLELNFDRPKQFGYSSISVSM